MEPVEMYAPNERLPCFFVESPLAKASPLAKQFEHSFGGMGNYQSRIFTGIQLSPQVFPGIRFDEFQEGLLSAYAANRYRNVLNKWFEGNVFSRDFIDSFDHDDQGMIYFMWQNSE